MPIAFESSTMKWQSFIGDKLYFILFILYLFIFNLMSFFDFQVLYFIAARLLIKVEPYGFDLIRLWPFSPKNHGITFSLWFGKQLDDGLPDITYTPHTMEYKFLKRARIHSLGNYFMKNLHKTFLGGKTFAEEERAKCRGIEIFWKLIRASKR